MGDQWYYNYNSVNYPPPSTAAQQQQQQEYNNQQIPQQQQDPTRIQYNQWQQQQQQYPNNVPAGAPFVPYPPVPSYPSPYNLPPPNVQQQQQQPSSSTIGYYNYPSLVAGAGQSFNVRPSTGQSPNDYAKELENYKYFKSKIENKDYPGRIQESMDPNGNNGGSGMMLGPPAARGGASSASDILENSDDLDFVYDDCDTHANEIAELYSYTEHADLHMNLSAFEEQMTEYKISHISWRQFAEEQRSSIILKVLDQLEFSNRETRMKSARCILYIAQGAWLGVQSDQEQIASAKENCLMLYKLGAFNAFVD